MVLVNKNRIRERKPPRPKMLRLVSPLIRVFCKFELQSHNLLDKWNIKHPSYPHIASESTLKKFKQKGHSTFFKVNLFSITARDEASKPKRDPFKFFKLSTPKISRQLKGENETPFFFKCPRINLTPSWFKHTEPQIFTSNLSLPSLDSKSCSIGMDATGLISLHFALCPFLDVRDVTRLEKNDLLLRLILGEFCVFVSCLVSMTSFLFISCA